MYARLVSPDLKPVIERKVVQMRKRSSVLHYPALMLVFSAIAAAVLYTRAFGLVYFVREALRGVLSDHTIALTMASIVGVVVSVLLVPLLRDMNREPIFYDYYYCAECNVLERHEAAICPRCHLPLTQRECFFYSHYKDEIKLAMDYGLEVAYEE